MAQKKKSLIVAFCTILMLIGTMATLAYFADQESATNTFTIGKINIELDETDVDNSSMDNRDKKNTYKMIPGEPLPKDPIITVKAGSVDCWVFVEVIDKEQVFNEKTYKASDFLTYSITTKNDKVSPWNKLQEENGVAVYYCKVVKPATDLELPCILEGEQVIVKDTVTEEMMQDVIEENKTAPTEKYPELTFKAYAIQLKKGGTQDNPQIFTPAEAWAQLNPPVESGE